MKAFLKKQWDIILLTFLLAVIVIINIHPNFIIMGLDNASPYFDPFTILKRIEGISSIIYGGILYQTPLLLILSKIGLSASIISNIYLFANLIIGSIGIYLISSSLTKKKLVRLLTTLIFISSLFTVWIFSQPNFLFIAAYGTIPLLIYFLGKKSRGVWGYILLTIFSFSFLTTSLNLVGFFLYILQTVVLVKLIYPKQKIKFLLLWATILIVFWLLSLQIVKLINGDSSFIITNIFDYIRELLNNPTVKNVSEGIIESEKTNSLIHTLSFSLGWTELHNSENTPIFQYYNLYRENIFYLILGAIPSVTALLTIFKVKTKQVILLTISLILFIFLSSKYGIMLIEQIPYLSHALRWASSKLWPLFIIPLISLNILFFKFIFTKPKKSLRYIITLLFISILFIYAIPVFKGNLLSTQTLVNIPEAYFELPGNSAILVLPQPQALYMREYDWGYYGSDFLSYINSSKFVDQANLYETGVEYNEILNEGTVPESINYILYDKSVETENGYENLLEGFRVVKSNQYYTLYERE